MHMEFDLINKHNAHTFEWVWQIGVGHGNSTRQITDKSQRAFFSVGKLIYIILNTVLRNNQPRRIALYSKIIKAGQHSLDSFTHAFQRWIAIVEIMVFSD